MKLRGMVFVQMPSVVYADDSQSSVISAEARKVCGLTSHNGEVIQRRNLSGRFPQLGRGTQRRLVLHKSTTMVVGCGTFKET